MNAERKPVTVLTGFLGSGKTTVLAKALKTPEFAGTVVIVNEFGEIGLDHLLLETSQERFALLDNGCVCCTVRDDLVETLLRLASADAPSFARVVIETTGLADPAPILHALMADERLLRLYRIDGVLTTVDAVNGCATLDAHGQAIKQIAVADRLLLTKTDLVDDAGPLLGRLAAINTGADIVHCREGEVDPCALIGAALDARGDVEAARALQTAPVSRFHADAAISTFSIALDAPMDWGAFRQWLEYLAMLKGEDLLRFKGLVNVAGREFPVVVHGVQHVFHPPRELVRWPDEDRRTRLVFITRGIARATIESTLVKFAGVEAASVRTAA